MLGNAKLIMKGRALQVITKCPGTKNEAERGAGLERSSADIFEATFLLESGI